MGIFSTVIPSSPNPETYAGFPEDQDDWGCKHWQLYYEQNKALYGAEKARNYFANDFDRIGFFSDGQWCLTDCNWLNFFKKEGLDYFDIASKVWCGADEVVGNVTESVKNVSGGIKNVSKWLVPGIVVAALGVGYYHRKKIAKLF